MKSWNRRFAAIRTALISAFFLTACAGPEAVKPRCFILGLDGLDPMAVQELMDAGHLPNLQRLQKEGAYAPLASEPPLLSPVVWTTVATGRRPQAHGIGHFVAWSDAVGRPMPVTSAMRKVPAVWNLVGEAGREVAVVGWWATWPAETVKGFVVSDHFCYHLLFREGIEGGIDLPGRTFPPGLEERARRHLRRPQDVGLEDLEPFVTVTAGEVEAATDFHDNLYQFRWALGAAETYSRIGLELWETERPDLAMVYIEATDTTAHLFGHLYGQQDLAGELAEQQRRYGRAVEQIYAWADALVGRVLDAMDEHTTLIVLSDHGFELGRLPDDPSTTRELKHARGNMHRKDGVLFLYGDRVRPGARLEDPSILDITPTLLALFGLPASDEMPGRVLTEALELEPPPRVPSYQRTGGDRAQGSEDSGAIPESTLAEDVRVNEAILRRLEGLGYLDTRSPLSDRVLAAKSYRQGDYEAAERLYRQQVEKYPEDATLLTSLAAVEAATGRYEAALQNLERAEALDPLSELLHYNRGLVHERRGDTEAAVRSYRNALRYTGDHEPSRQALVRLGVTTGQDTSLAPSTRRALDLAREAADLARRGAYDQAGARLDEALALDRDLTLLWQYKANVSYLAGDREGAVAALRRALELEPDNALFRENLRALQAEPRP